MILRMRHAFGFPHFDSAERFCLFELYFLQVNKKPEWDLLTDVWLAMIKPTEFRKIAQKDRRDRGAAMSRGGFKVPFAERHDHSAKAELGFDPLGRSDLLIEPVMSQDKSCLRRCHRFAAENYCFYRCTVYNGHQ